MQWDLQRMMGWQNLGTQNKQKKWNLRYLRYMYLSADILNLVDLNLNLNLVKPEFGVSGG
eukprot:SAG31_NODE_12744_length_919_cov_10.335366_1_plen_60_part_00